MKKAKILLMAVAVLGVVGGALAFKAKKYSFEQIYTTTAVPGTGVTCPLGPVVTLTELAGSSKTIYGTFVQNADCVTIPVTTIER